MARITAKNSLRNDNCCRMVVRNRRVCSSTGSSSMSQLSIRSLPPLLAASCTQIGDTQSVTLDGAFKDCPVMFQNFVADQLRIGVYGGETRLFNSLNKMNQNSNANGPDLLHKGDSKMERDVHDAVTLVTNMPKAVNKIFVAKSSIEQAMTNLNWASGTELIDDPPIEGNLQETIKRVMELQNLLKVPNDANNENAQHHLQIIDTTVDDLQAQDVADSNILTYVRDQILANIRGDNRLQSVLNFRNLLNKWVTTRQSFNDTYATLKAIYSDFRDAANKVRKCKIDTWQPGSCCSLQSAQAVYNEMNLRESIRKYDELSQTIQSMREQINADDRGYIVQENFEYMRAAAERHLWGLVNRHAAQNEILAALTVQENINMITALSQSTHAWKQIFEQLTVVDNDFAAGRQRFREQLIRHEELHNKIHGIITHQIHQGYELFKQWPTKLKLFVNEYSRINRLDAESQEEIKRMVMFCITSAIGGNAPPAVEDSKPDVFDVAVYTCTKLDEMMNTNMVDEVLEALKLRYTSMAELEVLKKFTAMNLCERIEKPITMVNKK